VIISPLLDILAEDTIFFLVVEEFLTILVVTLNFHKTLMSIITNEFVEMNPHPIAVFFCLFYVDRLDFKIALRCRNHIRDFARDGQTTLLVNKNLERSKIKPEWCGTLFNSWMIQETHNVWGNLRLP